MNKLVILVVFIVSAFVSRVNAQENDNKIHPIMGFKTGYNIYKQTTLQYQGVENWGIIHDNNGSFFIKMTAGLRWNNLTILGMYENTLLKDKIDNYIPVQDKFSIDVSYRLGDFTFNFQHWCSHSLSNTVTNSKIFNDSARRSISIEYMREF
jgi:hypothetical protein